MVYLISEKAQLMDGNGKVITKKEKEELDKVFESYKNDKERFAKMKKKGVI